MIVEVCGLYYNAESKSQEIVMFGKNRKGIHLSQPLIFNIKKKSYRYGTRALIKYGYVTFSVIVPQISLASEMLLSKQKFPPSAALQRFILHCRIYWEQCQCAEGPSTLQSRNRVWMDQAEGRPPTWK